MLGTIYILTPTVGWAWPALAPIVGSAAAALGYEILDPDGRIKVLPQKSLMQRKADQLRWVTLSLDEVVADVVSEELGNEERLSFQRDDFRLVFRKDAAGKFFIDVVGPKEKTVLDLRIRGEEFAREVVKKFAYHKMIEQIERRGATVIDEQVQTNGEVHLKARQWR